MERKITLDQAYRPQGEIEDFRFLASLGFRHIVSTYGSVYSLYGPYGGRLKRPLPVLARMSTNGLKVILYDKDLKPHAKLVRDLVAECFLCLNPNDRKYFVRHIDEDLYNCRLENLAISDGFTDVDYQGRFHEAFFSAENLIDFYDHWRG